MPEFLGKGLRERVPVLADRLLYSICPRLNRQLALDVTCEIVGVSSHKVCRACRR
ncbi:MAG: hypothetical protein RL701_8099 [Pseudomonadota bacterium]